MSSTSLPFLPQATAVRWREVVWPKEHGSWSLALEPVALALIAAPSVAGVWLAGATAAGFLARRPLKIVVRESAGARRGAAMRALAALAAGAVAALAGAIVSGGTAWLVWLAPTVALGGIFAAFDLRNAWRSEFAEIAGAAAFAWLTAVLAAAAGWSEGAAMVLGFAMVARAVPTVMFVRTVVRGAKAGIACRQAPAAAVAAAVALAGGAMLWRMGLAPAVLAIALGILFVRAVVLPRIARLRARTLGIVELCVGVGYVAAVGAAWSFR